MSRPLLQRHIGNEKYSIIKGKTHEPLEKKNHGKIAIFRRFAGNPFNFQAVTPLEIRITKSASKRPLIDKYDLRFCLA
jgi:hypothetical protein